MRPRYCTSIAIAITMGLIPNINIISIVIIINHDTLCDNLVGINFFFNNGRPRYFMGSLANFNFISIVLLQATLFYVTI